MGVVEMELGASGDGGESGGGVRARLRQEKCALGVGQGGKKRCKIFLVDRGPGGTWPSTQRVAA